MAPKQKLKQRVSFSIFFLATTISHSALPSDKCETVRIHNPDIDVSESVLASLSRAKLSREDFFRALQIVSRYENGGCWAGATGNSDGQLISVGTMQWNLGQGTLQPLLKRYSEKFSTKKQFESKRNQLMPKFGTALFDPSCRSHPVKTACKNFLFENMSENRINLNPELRSELNNLFNDPVMRQLQVDYFSRAVTSVLSDLERVYITPQPAPWQVAWAVDVKTQQGEKFPTDKNIRKVREATETLTVTERRKRLQGIIKWYDGLCDSGTSEGIKHDCAYNVKLWPTMFETTLSDTARERTIHFSHLIARTAQNIDGAYQANSFQRRATVAFGRGSVHRTIYDFQK